MYMQQLEFIIRLLVYSCLGYLPRTRRHRRICYFACSIASLALYVKGSLKVAYIHMYYWPLPFGYDR